MAHPATGEATSRGTLLVIRPDHRQGDAEDLRQTIEEAAALALLGREGRGVHVVMDFAAGVPPVLIDKVQIQQVLLNLIRNAVEAMHDRSRRELTIRTMAPVDGMVEVSVADSGPGLPAFVREKLFQPFVTTKPAGMGVGLSICRGIIEAHGGRTWPVDHSDGGADFHFTPPVASGIGAGLEQVRA